jgi:hypothetical protein
VSGFLDLIPFSVSATSNSSSERITNRGEEQIGHVHKSEMGSEKEISTKSRKLIITHLGLQRVAENEEQDFPFVAGSHEYDCTRFQAKFISERVCKLLSADCTLNRFTTEEVSDDESGFSLICSIYEG